MMTGLEFAGPISSGDTPSLEEVLAAARLNSLTRENPLLADLPAWFSTLRDHQRIAIREILTAYEEGARCVVLDAPTGSGKSLCGEVVRRLLSKEYRQATYICSSKALQDQFVRDYPYAKVLKGRSNYATGLYPERFANRDPLSCADCTKSPGQSESCMWCVSTAECPYERAKYAALQSSLAVLNTSYFLSECNGPGRFSRGGLVIADEADCLEAELMSHVEVRVSERRLKQYGLTTPKYVTKEESWREWAEEALAKVVGKPPRHDERDKVKSIRERKRHDILVGKLRDLQVGLESSGWVYTGDRTAVSFKPVTVDSVGQDKFWQHGDKFLLMSATVISADEMLESLGWNEDDEWRLVKCPSTFAPENRKVIVWPVANVTRNTKDEAYPKLVEGVKTILSRHPQDRVLVHSTSYALTSMLEEALRGDRLWLAGRRTQNGHPPIFTYTSPLNKDAAIEGYKNTSAAILLAPSLERGIDLPGDLCRVQILCKVPWRAQDKQVNARIYSRGGKVWYAVDAIRTVIQACGRAIRNEDDYATTYIIDEQFVNNLWGNYRRLFPEWFKKGLVWRVKGL